ncbi:hypothetical protein Hanom_Chr16g01466591 [Helianthus anomalus]
MRDYCYFSISLGLINFVQFVSISFRFTSNSPLFSQFHRIGFKFIVDFEKFYQNVNPRNQIIEQRMKGHDQPLIQTVIEDAGT